MQDKILITGASGFIGSHLVDYLLKQKINKNKLILLDIKKSKYHQNLNFIQGDIRDKKTIKQAMKGVKTVFHLAAKIDFDGPSYDSYQHINLCGTKNLLDQAIKNKNFKKFVFYSSIGVHGLPYGVGDIKNYNESALPNYNNFYGRSKWEGELLVRKYFQKYDLPYAIIRPASVYGPREKGPTLALFKAIGNNFFFQIGSGQNKMHYVYVTDLVAATYLAWRSKYNSEYIIAGKKPVKFKDLIKYIYKYLDKKQNNIILPKNLALVLAYIFNIFYKLTNIKLPLFPSRVKTMTSSYYYDISKAKKDLGYKPKIDIKTGLKLTAEYYLKNNWL